MKVVLKNLTKKFPNLDKRIKTEVVAVDSFDFEIPDGKLVALLGPSGCGKSTVLNMISGLLEPTSGQIFFGDEEVTSIPPEKRGIGLVFQNYALYPHLTVEQNIRFPLENLKGADKLSKEEMAKRVLEAARLVQIEDYMARKPAELSGGQQQRVAIARALVKMPRVLLLDEPLSNLDARLRIQTREELRRIQTQTGITTLFVTHDQDEAMSISDEIIVMKAGVFQQKGAPQEVYDNPVNLFVAKFLGVPPINVFKGTKDGRELYYAIRPEGFIPDPEGDFEMELERIEVMGRDTSLICKHKEAVGASVRCIISSEDAPSAEARSLRFRIKPNKIFYFDSQTEERISVKSE